MTPEQALKTLDGAASMANLQREGHVLVQGAVQILLKAVKDHKDASENAPEDATEGVCRDDNGQAENATP